MARPTEELLWKPPVVSLTQEEVDEMNDLAAVNKIPRDWYDRYLAATEKQVFGHDVKHDRHGNPIEQGKGSAAQPSRNSLEAYKSNPLGRKTSPDPDFKEQCERMEAEIKAFEAKQADRRAAAKVKRNKAA